MYIVDTRHAVTNKYGKRCENPKNNLRPSYKNRVSPILSRYRSLITLLSL